MEENKLFLLRLFCDCYLRLILVLFSRRVVATFLEDTQV